MPLTCGIIIGACLLAITLLRTAPPADPEVRPNIILIVIDCLRPDHMSCYGYSRDTSPAIDALAAEGIRYTSSYSNAAWTKPSVATMFSGLYPNEHGVVNTSSSMPDEVLTIAERLKARGYRTMFFNGGNVFLKKIFNFHQGFDFYRYYPHKTKNAGHLTDDFISLLSAVSETPFFVYLHYMDAHTPYTKNSYNDAFLPAGAPRLIPGTADLLSDTIKTQTAAGSLSQQKKDALVALYDGQIRFIDHNVKRIIAGLERADLLSHTTIIITSDHGEEFWEHGNFEHGHTLYNEVLRVPLIVWSKAAKPKIDSAPIDLRVMPDIIMAAAEAAHNDPTADRPLKDRNIFATGLFFGSEKYCLISNNQKIIINTEETTGKAPLTSFAQQTNREVYDLAADPGEIHNISTAQEGTGRLAAALMEYRNHPRRFPESNDAVVIDAPLKQQLKSLGYIQ